MCGTTRKNPLDPVIEVLAGTIFGRIFAVQGDTLNHCGSPFWNNSTNCRKFMSQVKDVNILNYVDKCHTTWIYLAFRDLKAVL
jgi:hypothetical protein